MLWCKQRTEILDDPSKKEFIGAMWCSQIDRSMLPQFLKVSHHLPRNEEIGLGESTLNHISLYF